MLEALDGVEGTPDLPRLSSPTGEADINYTPCRYTTSLGVTVQIIPIFDVDGKLLLAVPYQVWSRTVASRVLAKDMLLKPISMEVFVAQEEDRAMALEDGSSVKVWLGLVKPGFLPGFSVDEGERAFEYVFKDVDQNPVLPLAQSQSCGCRERSLCFLVSAGGGAGSSGKGSRRCWFRPGS